jgi:hypothetical protein
MVDLLDMRAERIGVTFHRNKILNPFMHVARGPLTDMLFAITRPVEPARKKRLREIIAEKAARQAELLAATAQEPFVAPKGMVSYRREYWAPCDKPLP